MLDDKLQKEMDRITVIDIAYQVRISPNDEEIHDIYLGLVEAYRIRYDEEFYFEIDETRGSKNLY